MKICVLIPAYNEAKTIPWLIQQVRVHNVDIIVVDDGSGDNSAALAQQNGAVVIAHLHNQGKGACLIHGFEYARVHGYDAVIIMDGDGQHHPDDIPSFVRKAQEGFHGIIVGDRMSDIAHMPFVRLMTNRFMSWLISREIGQYIPDTQCGYRLVSREVFEQVRFSTHNYEIESEMLIRAARAGMPIISVPVRTIYEGQKSQIRPLRDTLRFFIFMRRVHKELFHGTG